MKKTFIAFLGLLIVVPMAMAQEIAYPEPRLHLTPTQKEALNHG